MKIPYRGTDWTHIQMGTKFKVSTVASFLFLLFTIHGKDFM